MEYPKINILLQRLLTVFGLLLVSAGLLAFLMQRWEDLTLTTRLLCSLGFGAVAYGFCLYAYRRAYVYVGDTLLIIASIAIWYGCYVVAAMRNIQIVPYNASFSIAQSGMLTGLFVIAWLVGDSFFATMGAVLLTQYVWWEFGANIFVQQQNIWYGSLVLFNICIILGYWLRNRYLHVYLLRLLGSIGTGYIVLCLGYWDVKMLYVSQYFYDSQYFLWRCLLPLLGVGYTWLGLRFHDHATLAGGICSLVATILVITLTYGRDIVGLPIALALCGFVCLLLCYSGVMVKRWRAWLTAYPMRIPCSIPTFIRS